MKMFTARSVEEANNLQKIISAHHVSKKTQIITLCCNFTFVWVEFKMFSLVIDVTC